MSLTKIWKNIFDLEHRIKHVKEMERKRKDEKILRIRGIDEGFSWNDHI